MSRDGSPAEETRSSSSSSSTSKIAPFNTSSTFIRV
eukprot:CAMPEP_0184476312 /NCGR_PEP_ID=MMETSP0740-20130409/147021_1 /TAXON_ID=385413 /ORGANISM="Thalassiosira miniscula, Strain CCMP1093" /LENGTH=35 /DNA_ID= /DNA_START= /DNA_END= /DNA_ORIENTATION=